MVEKQKLRTAIFWVIRQRVAVNNCHYLLRNNPEGRRSHLLRGGSLKSRINKYCLISFDIARLQKPFYYCSTTCDCLQTWSPSSFRNSEGCFIFLQLSQTANRDTRHRTQDTRHRTQDTRHKTQDTGHKTQDTRNRTQDTRHRTQDTRHKTQDTGHSGS
jgi:hypothetical protein